MASFLDRFPNQLIMQNLGDDLIYIQPGQSEGVAINAIFSHELEKAWAVDSYRNERKMIIDAIKSDVPNCKKGAKFIYKNKTYIVDAIENDDGYIMSLEVRAHGV